MKYFLDIQDSSFLSANRSNAISKPRLDTLHTAERQGYLPLVIKGDFSLEGKVPRSLGERIRKKLSRVLFSHNLQKANSIAEGSDVFVQYPFLSTRMYEVLRALKSKHCRIIVLFHDYYALRENRQHDEAEQSLLMLADVAIVHSEAMAEVFRANGCTAEIRVLRYFDYCLPADMPLVCESETDICDIVFAGNLSKSGFVSKLVHLSAAGVSFCLYGRPECESRGNVKYCGCFDSDNPTAMHGQWGLVWDGEETSTCSGLTGEYLRYNAPFKFSLYLSMGLPVIVWQDSAMARYVQEEKIGICVETLEDISEMLSSLTATDIAEMRDNVAKVSKRLRSGMQLAELI